MRQIIQKQMKIFYIISFFADTVLLLTLAYFFFQVIDTKGGSIEIIFLGSGILLSILLLVILFKHYMKQPATRSLHK
ncbi:MAG: hypothetical protein JSS70_11980 [Bacteroidetes bacterium]|nr:hypothetical protein [Bacteroidota bacterium]